MPEPFQPLGGLVTSQAALLLCSLRRPDSGARVFFRAGEGVSPEPRISRHLIHDQAHTKYVYSCHCYYVR